MNIRKEELKDYAEIYEVVKAAFKSAEHSDGNEQDLVNKLRAGESYIPELSLVAEENGRIVGHIMFTKAKAGMEDVLALAPLSVLPEYQRKGIGTKLVKEGHRAAQRLGYKYSVVLGSEKYYSRLGYVPASVFGIIPPFDVPDENFMVYSIVESSPCTSGVMRYAKEFGIE